MNIEKWFVIKTNPRAEKLVSERLLAIGIKNYLPIKRVLKQWKDRKKWVDEVILKNYVFVNISEKSKNDVFEVFGVIKYLFVAGSIAIVTDKEIDVLKLFCQANDLKIENKGYEIGDNFEIISGALIGMIGKLNSNQKGNTISIYIAQLGLFANIKINLSDVKRIEN